MRSGATQQSPTSNPLVSVVVAGDTHTTRIVHSREDEQVWGGSYIIELDNSDESLNSKDYEGEPITLNHAFSAESGSDLAPLWVFTQAHDSRKGKLILRLNCIDIWGLLSMVTSNVGAEYWNYPEQAPGEPYADATHYNKTILDIITSVISAAVGKSVVLDDDDGIINSQKPPIRIANARTGVRQLLEMTESFLLWKGDSKFHVIKPSAHATAYSYSVANLFFSSVVEAGVTIPNRVIYHGTDSGGNLISGTATDATSYGKIGIYIDRHYYYSEDEIRLLTTQAQVDALAASTLAKIQGERNQGLLIAPMHCAQELFDKVSVTDSRYSTPVVTTGYVHRILREYDSGLYRITLHLGGVTSGFTPDGGGIPVPLADRESFPELTTSVWRIPLAIQGFHHDIVFTSVDWDTVSWASGTVKFYDGTTQSINLGSHNLANGLVHYIYFDLDDASPATLKVTSNYLSALSTKTGVVCMIQRGSDTSVKAVVIPSYGKEPLITADVIYLTGLLDKLPDGTWGKVLSTTISAGRIKLEECKYNEAIIGSTYDLILATEITSGHIKLTSALVADGTWYNYAGVEISAATGIKLTGSTTLTFQQAGYSSSHIAPRYNKLRITSSDVVEFTQDIEPWGAGACNLGSMAGYWGYLYVGTCFLARHVSYYMTVGSYIGHAVVQPNTSDTCYLGLSTKYWKFAYINWLYRKNEFSFQHLDDLALIKGMKASKKNPKLIDKATMPVEILEPRPNKEEFDEMKGMITRDAGIEAEGLEDAPHQAITVRKRAEIEVANLEDDWEPGIDTSAEIGLINGAIRQLLERIEVLEAR